MASSNSDKIQQLVAAQLQGESLSQAFYKDQDVYRAEISNIFLQHWLFAGHESQIPTSGDYFTVEFDTESVIILRTAAGEIKAHVNVCRHRGSRICLEKSGSQKSLTCPYHAWSYNLDGELISARNMPDDFAKSENGLHKINVALLGGLIFICLSENPPSLTSLREDLKQPFELFGMFNMKLAEQKSYRIPANWKLAVENYQECYHCGPSHPEFAQIHAMAKSPKVFQTTKANFTQAHQANPKCIELNHYFDLAEKGQEGYQYDRNPLLRGALSGSLGGKPVAPLLGSLDEYDGGASELMIGPLSYFLIYDDHMLGYRFLPVSVDECICDVYWFVNESAVEGKDYQLDQLTWLWDVTTQADKTIIMNNQKGVNSRFYKPGRLSEMESFQQSFLNWYLQSLTK
ncbi:aromatic ring-hydroxylating dioxygenase subunit alpha [uncultured Paraglaciecola sp.]|jgi:phenylpropionate dioxygenase-like ring-hydroxylating dioxygenase large terminal subunit|uniref:aromatic ring-hydroxylating oxygenase subunit alpha n=1 Tax=uncultured Paraglaciecola sp. TaxID=1765024 RepID=UPI0025DBDD7F|nr:aromatic ring-hydroxylating dioxygenase subunit alpha [uncultured Paraglaciecola sp.]